MAGASEPTAGAGSLPRPAARGGGGHRPPSQPRSRDATFPPPAPGQARGRCRCRIPPLPRHLCHRPRLPPPPPTRPPYSPVAPVGADIGRGEACSAPLRAAGAVLPAPLATLASRQGASGHSHAVPARRANRICTSHRPRGRRTVPPRRLHALRRHGTRHTAQPRARAGRMAAGSWFSLVCRKEPAAAGAHGHSGSGKALLRGALATPQPHQGPGAGTGGRPRAEPEGTLREHPGTALSRTADTPRWRRGPGDSGVAGLRSMVTARLPSRCHRAHSPSAATATGQGVAAPPGPPGLSALARGPAPAGVAAGATEPPPQCDPWAQSHSPQQPPLGWGPPQSVGAPSPPGPPAQSRC